MNLIEAALSTYWAMEEPALRQLFAIVTREISASPDALEAFRAKSLDRAERARVRDGVAIIDAYGPLVKRANMVAEMSGATSYEIMFRDLETARRDPGVLGAVLHIDSPGGEALGIGELAEAVHAFRAEKPIVAYVGGMGASAGYWLASAASKIIISDSAILGSIGVQIAMLDRTEADAKAGVRTLRFVSSQSPGKNADPSTDAGAAAMQKTVDSLAQVFVDAVAKYRGVSAEDVLARFGQGATEVGKDAVVAGLADEIGTFEGALAMVVAMSRKQPARPGGFAGTTYIKETPAMSQLQVPSAKSAPVPAPSLNDEERVAAIMSAGNGETGSGDAEVDAAAARIHSAGRTEFSSPPSADPLPVSAGTDEEARKLVEAILSAGR